MSWEGAREGAWGIQGVWRECYKGNNPYWILLRFPVRKSIQIPCIEEKGDITLSIAAAALGIDDGMDDGGGRGDALPCGTAAGRVPRVHTRNTSREHGREPTQMAHRVRPPNFTRNFHLCMPLLA